MQNVVKTVIVAHSLHRGNISRILDDTDRALVTLGIRADRADLGIREVLADRTKTGRSPRLHERVRKRFYVFLLHGENMKSQALG